MDFDPDNIADPQTEIPPSERKLSVYKLLAAILVVLIAGTLLLPLFYYAFERGWLEWLGFCFVALLVVSYGLQQYLKQRR